MPHRYNQEPVSWPLKNATLLMDLKYECIRAGDDDIRIIKSPAGFPGRAIFNRSPQESVDGKGKPRICMDNCIRIRDPKTTEFCIVQALPEAYKGNLKD